MLDRTWETIFDHIILLFLTGLPHPSEQEKSKHGNIDDKSNAFCSHLSLIILKRKDELEEEIDEILNDIRFGNWASDQRSRWDLYKADQKAHWERLVRDKVDSVFRYDAFVNKYKQQLRTEANYLFRDKSWMEMPKDTKDQKFAEIFNRIVLLARAEHEPVHITVYAKVEDIFFKSPLTSSVIVQPPTKHGNTFLDIASAAIALFWNVVRSSGDRSFHRKEIMRAIKNDIEALLLDVKRYDDETVMKCIKLTATAFNDSRESVNVEFKREMYMGVKGFLQERLRNIQNVWDIENGVSSRFESSREEMKQYFELVGKGCQGAKLLRETVDNWLMRNLRRAFQQELATIVLRA